MRVFMMLIPYAGLALLATCAPLPEDTGAKLFLQNCVICHGPEGRGDGRMASDLPVPPADLTAISGKNGGSFPKEQVMIAIHGYQGQEVYGLMPSFAEAVQGPTVAWTAPDGREIATPKALVSLADYIETLQE